MNIQKFLHTTFLILEKISVLIIIFLFAIKCNMRIYQYHYQNASKVQYEHLFFMKTYFYRDGHSFKHLYNGTQENGFFVSLFNVDHSLNIEQQLSFKCIQKGRFNTATSIQASSLKVHDVLQIRSGCRLNTYRILCPNIAPSSKTANQMRFQLSLNGQAMDFKTPVDHVSGTRRRLVFCPGRMYNFERWHVLVTVLELYHRHLGVQLTVVHVQSVRAEIYGLMQLYEREGMLGIRSYLGMPLLDTLPYNPNSETVWTGQVTHNLDCLYAFRENTDFLILADWDDIVMVPSGLPIASILGQHITQDPSIAALYVRRAVANLPTLETIANNSILDFWASGIDYSLDKFELLGKTIVRPALVDSCAVHVVHGIRQGYRTLTAPLDSIRIIHARDQQERMPHILNTSFIAGPFIEFLKRHRLDLDFLQKLPKSEPLVSQVRNCFGGGVMNVSRCINHYQCSIREEMAGGNHNLCVIYENKWHKMADDRAKMMLVIFKSGTLRHSEKCKSIFI